MSISQEIDLTSLQWKNHGWLTYAPVTSVLAVITCYSDIMLLICQVFLEVWLISVDIHKIMFVKQPMYDSLFLGSLVC